MNIVATGSSFDINFIPSVAFGCVDGGTLTNTNTNTDTTLTKDSNIEYYDNDYYLGATITYTVAEGEFYDIVLNDDEGNECYRGKIFVTDQTNYSINNGAYTERSSDNDYITR